MNRLKTERSRKGWRQIDLAEAADVSLTLIWVLETSKGKRVSREVKERVAKALKVEATQLFPGETKEEW